MADDSQGLHTRSLHAGHDPEEATGARAPPIHQTTSYVFESADQAAARFGLEEDGYVYSRLTNPTTEALAERLTALEEGVGAVTTASGMAALDTATFLLASAGDNVVASAALYGGTRTYLDHTARRRGIEARFVDPLDDDAYEDEIDADTAYVLVETVGNPALVTPDLERVADIAGDAGVPLIADNTFATPALCNPIEYGADIVWHSTTKWIHGAGSTVGGALVDGGTFPWDGADYPELAAPNPAYGGLNFRERFGEAAFAAAARARGLRDLGNQQSPFDAWVTLQKLETLPLRMERHCANAAEIARFLGDHDDVSWVTYPGLESHPTHDNASEYLEEYGGMVTFGVEGGYEAARTVTEETELASLLANVGDAKSLIIHPASTTHAQLREAEREASGVPADLVRLSVGLEDPADIAADLDRALERARTAPVAD